MAVTGTSGKDFIHQAGDGHTAPSGYNDLTGLTGGEDTVNGMGGNDLIYMGATLDAGDTINGGGDAGDGQIFDVVELFGDYISHTVQGHTVSDALTLDASTLQNIPTLKLDGGTSHLAGVQIGYDITLSAQNPAPNGFPFNVDGSGLNSTNAMIIDGSAAGYGLEILGGDGANTLTGGTGNDTFVLKNTANLATSSIDGGGGSDILEIQHADGAQADLSGVKNIHTIGFDIGSGDPSLVAGDSVVRAGEGLTIDATATHSFSFDGHAESDGSFLILGSGGDDTIVGGGQADQIEAGAGNNSVSGNGGNDFIVVTVAQNTINRIDGGAGNDTARFLGSSTPQTVTFDDAALQNVETLQMAFVGSLTMADGNVAAGHVLQVSFNAASIASPNSFDGTAETDGAYNFNLSYSSILAVSGGWSVIGGASNDIFRLNDVNHSGAANSWNGNGGANTLDYSADSQGLTLDARTGTATGSGSVSDHFSNFTVFKFGGGANTFFGSSAGETVSMLSGGNESAEGFGGNDSFFFGATLGALDVVDGGDGSDTLTLNGDYSAGLTFNATTVRNVETIVLDGGHSYKLTTNDATVAAGKTLTVNGAGLGAGDSLLFNGAAEKDGQFIVRAGAGTNVLTGGAGADAFQFAAATLVSGDAVGGDTVNGGTGAAPDRLVFTSTGTVAASAFANVTHIEQLVLANGVNSTNNVAIPDALVGSADDNHILAVFGGTGNDTIDGHLVTTAANRLNLYAGTGNDTLTGGAGADLFIFASGALNGSDSVNGGAGSAIDTLDITNGGTIVAASLAQVSHIEKILLGPGDHALTLTDALVGSADDNHVVTVVGNAGIDRLSAANVTTAANSVRFEGLAGADRFVGGAGADRAIYAGVSDSTGDANGTSYDTLAQFNVTGGDRIDLPNAQLPTSVVTHTGGPVDTGGGTFDSELATALGNTLAAHTAVELTVAGGNLNGHHLLVVNPTGSAGYVSGADYIFDITGHTGAIATSTFI